MNRYLFAICLLFGFTYSCHGQQGPTQPSVSLSWTQSNTPGVTANCVYRSTGAGTTPAPPAIFCSTTPVTSYIDNGVTANTTYVYAATAKIGSTEGAYSNDVTAAIPISPNAPNLNPPSETGESKPGKEPNLQAVVRWKLKSS
jgi:hypothetical protein